MRASKNNQYIEVQVLFKTTIVFIHCEQLKFEISCLLQNQMQTSNMVAGCLRYSMPYFAAMKNTLLLG